MTPQEILEEMIIYVLLRLGPPHKMDTLTLAAILFDADYGHYISHAAAISAHNSVITLAKPTPHNLAAILAAMEGSDVITHSIQGGRSLIVAQRENPPAQFSNTQSSMLNCAIANHIGGDPIFTLTGFESVGEGDPIPYATISYV